MKNITTLWLVVLLASASANLTAQSAKSKQVIAVHQVELQDHIDAKAFEKFIHSEIAPIYNRMKGQTFTLVKGDRGGRIGSYAIILQFDSIEDRNRIYPENEEPTGDWGKDEIWETLSSMTIDLWTESMFTDYVEILQ